MTQNNATITIANQSFPSFRTELNQTLQDIYTNFAGSADPNATNVAFAGSLYYDTDDNILKLRNEDADAYISLFTTDQSADTAVPTNLNVVVDTTPQLGGTLDTKGQLVQIGDSSGATDDRLLFGALQITELEALKLVVLKLTLSVQAKQRQPLLMMGLLRFTTIIQQE